MEWSGEDGPILNNREIIGAVGSFALVPETSVMPPKSFQKKLP